MNSDIKYSDRMELLWSHIKKDHLNPYQQLRLKETLAPYEDRFLAPGEEPRHTTDVIQHIIPIKEGHSQLESHLVSSQLQCNQWF